MANRNLYPSWCFGAGRTWMSFELLGVGGAVAPTLSTDAAQAVTSVTYIGVGVYDITLKDPWKAVVRADASLNDTANDGGYATVGALTNENTSTPLKIRVYTRAAAGTAAEIAAGRRLGISLDLRNSNGWGQR